MQVAADRPQRTAAAIDLSGISDTARNNDISAAMESRNGLPR